MKQNYQTISIYGMTIILAACSILYELLIAQALSSLATNTVIWYSLTIGFYLGAMGVGASFCDRLYREKTSREALFEVEIFLSIFGGASVLVVYLGHMLMSFMWVRDAHVAGLCLFFLMALIVILGVGFFTGLELPLLIRMGNEGSPSKRVTNRVLSADYFGSLVGGVVFPLILLPKLSLLMIGFHTALLNLGVALVLLFFFVQDRGRSMVKLGSIILLLLAFILGSGRIEDVQQYFYKKYYYYGAATKDMVSLFAKMNDFPKVERFHSAYQKIDIVKLPADQGASTQLMKAYSAKYKEDPNAPHDYALFLDGSFQFWMDFEEVYHEYFAHVPIMAAGTIPKKVLVLGAGDGFLLRELVKYPQIESITLVELDEKVITMAKTHPVFRYAGKGALDDPRVNIIIDDGYHFVKNAGERFDAVYLDFPDPKDYNLSKLYSREFYVFVQKRLNDDGFIVLDAPGVSFSLKRRKKEAAKEYVKTLQAAGFKTVIPYASNLEVDNAGARAIFSRLVGDAKEIVVTETDWTGTYAKSIKGREAIITRLIEDFVKDYQQRFIIAKKERQEFKPQYKAFGIKNYIMNKKRFYLAFDSPVETLAEDELRDINSIMRPTIPDLSLWWRLKLPY